MNKVAETLESELAHVSVETETGGNNLLQKENEKSNQELGIKFGSHGTDEPGKTEVMNVPASSFPKDAVDEWPAPKEIHSFYMVKYRIYDDQKAKVKLDQADKELKRLNQARFQVTEKLRAKRTERAQVIAQLKALGDETKQFRVIMDEKKKEMEPLHQALGKLRSSNTGGRERSFIYSSEEELNDAINSLQFRIQHESIPLSEEKQIVRQIKQLEGTRDKVIANAAVRAKIQDSLGEKDAIQDQVKLIGAGLDGVRKEQLAVKAKLAKLDDEKKAIDKVIESLQEELDVVTGKRDQAFEKIQQVRKQYDEGNAPYYQNRTTLIKAKDLAARKNVEGVKEFVETEVDKFISLWSSNKNFRDDYERRILTTLDARQLSRDGRMRNPDEKPLVVPPEPSAPSETVVVAKSNTKQLKEDSNTSTAKREKSTVGTKQQKENSNEVASPEVTVEQRDVKDEDTATGLEKPQKVPLDEIKLKELKREEEIAKAKQALERKRKLAEKAAAKAAIKAQKEAEKKLKEREKKAKKKAAASVSVAPEDSTDNEAGDVAAEQEKTDEIIQPAAPSKTKERKEKTVRNRGRTKGPDSLPKIILKRKKSSTNYWVWAAAIAAVVVLLAAIGYYYFM